MKKSEGSNVSCSLFQAQFGKCDKKMIRLEKYRGYIKEKMYPLYFILFAGVSRFHPAH